jgi:hypothetical protein
VFGDGGLELTHHGHKSCVTCQIGFSHGPEKVRKNCCCLGTICLNLLKNASKTLHRLTDQILWNDSTDSYESVE